MIDILIDTVIGAIAHASSYEEYRISAEATEKAIAAARAGIKAVPTFNPENGNVCVIESKSLGVDQDFWDFVMDVASNEPDREYKCVIKDGVVAVRCNVAPGSDIAF